MKRRLTTTNDRIVELKYEIKILCKKQKKENILKNKSYWIPQLKFFFFLKSLTISFKSLFRYFKLFDEKTTNYNVITKYMSNYLLYNWSCEMIYQILLSIKISQIPKSIEKVIIYHFLQLSYSQVLSNNNNTLPINADYPLISLYSWNNYNHFLKISKLKSELSYLKNITTNYTKNINDYYFY